MNFTTASGQWDASYDIWFDTQANPSGQNDGEELMIWANHAGAPEPAGSQVRLWSCNGTAAQQWQVNSNGTVTNPNSGKCLDATGQGTANGTLLQIWDCYGGGTQANQVWRLG